MSDKIYVPGYTPQKYPCVVYSENYITAYTSMPYPNSVIGFDRYHIKNHYDKIPGSQQFSQNNWSFGCLEQTRLTSDFYYRHDLDNILISFTLIVVISFYLPFAIYIKLFKRRL